MKIFITTRLPLAPKNYLVLSPSVTTDTDTMKRIKLAKLNIDEYADDGEVTELVLDHVIDYIPGNEVMPVLTALIKKVQHGGTLVINGVDAYLVSKAFVELQLSIEQFNELIHGDNIEMPKTVNLTVQGINDFLTQINMEVTHRRIDSCLYSVKAKRP